MAKHHPFLDLLIGYEAASDAEGKGKRFVSRAISGGISGERPGKLSSRIMLLLRGFVNLVSYTSTRVYGLFLVSFGLLTLLLHFALDYLSPSGQLSVPVMIAGALMAILAIPFLSFDRPIAIAMQEFSLTDSIFFEFFCIQRMQKKTVGARIHPAIGLFLGVALAALGAVVPVWYVIGGIGAAVYIFLAVLSPEFSFFFVFLVMPYLPMMEGGDVVMAALVALTILSFVRKIIEGKRIYYFEQYDLLLLVMLTLVFINGIISGGMDSILSSAVMLMLGFGAYALTGSLVANRRLADCVIKANIISSLPVSIIAIVQFIVALAKGEIADYGGSSATFDSPSMLGAFLLVSAAFMLYFIISRHKISSKISYAVYLVVTLTAMACTMRVWLAVALAFGTIAYLSLRTGHRSWLWIGGVALALYLPLFLPASALRSLATAPFMSVIGADTYVEAWISTRSIILDHFLVGVGSGDFAEVPYSANFFLQIACEAGIFVLLIFLLIFIVRLRHASIYSPYTKSSQVTLLSKFSNIIVAAMLVYGVFISLWSTPTVYYLFWCIFGLGSASMRISKHEFDDRVAYFSDGSGVDSSAIDISLKRS